MPALIFRIVCKWTYYISLNVLLKVTNWVFPYPYFLLRWLIISQLLHQNIFQHMVVSDHTENSYIIVQTFFKGFWSEMKLYRSCAIQRGCLHNELIVRSLSLTLAESARLAWQMKRGVRWWRWGLRLMEPTVRWRAQETSSSLLFFFLLLRLKSSSITIPLLC